jgi:DNA helicase-2/ATP-dependent DNA helicase PcrA
MEDLNEHQRKAAEYNGKHLLVLAGAGTGKTKTIVARAEYLIRNGIQPNKIAILSFTRKSAKEIAERLKLSVSGDINKSAITGKTFHSWCNEIMHLFPEHFPHHNYTPLDEDDRLSAMGLVVGRNLRDSENEKISKTTILQIYSYAINTLSSLTKAIIHVKYHDQAKDDEHFKSNVENYKTVIAPIIQKYIDYKRERRYIDYDDMLNVVAAVLEQNAVVRNAVNSRYEYVLVDEMQDTNPLQYKLLKAFVDRSKLFCVGDDAQSIYAFRGADFKTIHSFSTVIPDSEILKLELNYRSTQEILDLSNWILEQSPLNYNKKLKAFRGNGLKPSLIHIKDDWEEADLVTNDVLKCVSEGGKYSDSMILGRSSFSLSKVEGACLSKKIPYVKYGGISLMQSAHVRDVVSVMRIVSNIYDEIAWIRFLQLWEGIGDIKAAKVISSLIGLSSFDAMIEELKKYDVKGVLENVTYTLQKVRQYIANPSRAIKEALDSLQNKLQRRYKEEWSYRVSDFEVLQEVAQSNGSISEFIMEYVLDPVAETTFKGRLGTTSDAVVLSTIHSAKGLEANEVHVINVNPFHYPSSRSMANGEDSIEEERRCLYVAVTRSKEKLKLYRFTKSLHTQYSDNDSPATSKYFLNNLPGELVIKLVDGLPELNYPRKETGTSNSADFPGFNFE